MSTVISTVVIQTTNSNCLCEHLENILQLQGQITIGSSSYASSVELFIIAIVTLPSLCRKELVAGEKTFPHKISEENISP